MAELTKFVICYDLDKTLCTKKSSKETYEDVKPLQDNIDLLNILHNKGAEVIIDSARNMLSQNNEEAKVIKNIGKTTLDWLEFYNVFYDGITFGKTMANCYIDDKALRPKELIAIYDSLEDKSLEALQIAIEKYLEEN